MAAGAQAPARPALNRSGPGATAAGRGRLTAALSPLAAWVCGRARPVAAARQSPRGPLPGTGDGYDDASSVLAYASTWESVALVIVQAMPTKVVPLTAMMPSAVPALML